MARKTKVINPRVTDWYDRVVSSQDKCVFCDLKDKYIIASDSGMVLTANLYPYLDGHLLIISKRHIERFHELSTEEWVAVSRLIKVGLDLLREAFGVEESNILYREGGVGSGKSLGHLHIHIMPCVPGFLSRDEKGIFYTYQNLKLDPKKISRVLRTFKHKKFMKQACVLCDRSTCGYKTGCVIVKNGEVLAEGWNASLPGEIYCQAGECIRKKEKLTGGMSVDKVCSIHAEAYALANCARKGISVEGSEVYVTTFPCIICCRMLAKAKVSKVIYMSQYSAGRVGEPILKANGVQIDQIKEKDVWS